MVIQKKIDRTLIKYIAAIAMIIDHIAMFFLGGVPALYVAMRFIGRITAPVMCFFITEGYYNTSSKKKYGLRLGLVGLVSQIPYSLAKYGSPFTSDLNVIITLFICFVVLLAYEKIQNEWSKWFVIGVAFVLSFACEWGFVAPLWVLIFFTLRYKPNRMIVTYICVVVGLVTLNAVYFAFNNGLWYSELWQIGLLLFVPIYFMYNGKKGSDSLMSKCFFYALYPMQFVVVWLIHLLY